MCNLRSRFTKPSAQLITRANAACRRADVAAAQFPAPSDSSSTLARYARRLSPIVQRLVDKLGALSVNATDHPTLERCVSALRTGDRRLGLMARLASAAQLPQAASLVTSQSIPAVPADLGAPMCGASVSSS
jgi:hypothetical protein